MRIIVDINAPYVDEYDEYLDPSMASIQVENSLDDAAKSTLEDEAPQFVENYEDGDEQEQVINEGHHDVEMAVKAEKWIGVLVTKEFDGKRSMGKVMHYNGESQLFKIGYETGVSEEVNFQELQQIAAPPVLVRDYLERFDPRESEENEKKLKRHMSDETVPVHPRYPSSVEPQPAAEAQVPKKKKYKKGGASTSPYIPLAVREKKKDEYVYYYC